MNNTPNPPSHGPIAQVSAAASAKMAASSVDPAVTELETVLREMLTEHEQLLSLAAMHRRAISKADTAELGRCVQQHNGVIQRVAELENRRLVLVVRILENLGQSGASAGQPGAQERPTVSRIARMLSEPAGGRLLALAERLREVLKRLHREQTAIKEAAMAVAAHMEGVLRQIAGRLSHAGTYGRGGAVDASVQVVSALDVRM